MSDNLTKLTELIVDIEDLAKARGIRFVDDIPRPDEDHVGDYWGVIIRLEIWTVPEQQEKTPEQ